MLENERWFSPLDEEIRSALASSLAQRLGTQDVSGLPLTMEMPVVKVQLQIQRLDTWLGRMVEFEVGGSLSSQGHRLICSSHLTQTIQPGYIAML